MWKKSIRFVGRYLAIGVLVGIGFTAVDAFYWRLIGSKQVAALQQSIDSLSELQEKLVFEPIVNHVEEKQSGSATSSETISGSDLIRPTPYFVNGKLQGYRVYPGSDYPEFRSLGLRPGDLVTEIDGSPLSNSAVALELFGKALGGQPVQFSILTGDELKKIEIKVD